MQRRWGRRPKWSSMFGTLPCGLASGLMLMNFIWEFSTPCINHQPLFLSSGLVVVFISNPLPLSLLTVFRRLFPSICMGAEWDKSWEGRADPSLNPRPWLVALGELGIVDGGWAVTGGWEAAASWVVIAQGCSFCSKLAPHEALDLGTQMKLPEKWPIVLAVEIMEKKSANKNKKIK